MPVLCLAALLNARAADVRVDTGRNLGLSQTDRFLWVQGNPLAATDDRGNKTVGKLSVAR